MNEQSSSASKQEARAPQLGGKLAECVTTAATVVQEQKAQTDSALEKFIKNYAKREPRWLERSGRLVGAFEQRLNDKGFLGRLRKLFSRRRRKMDADLLLLLQEMQRRDREQHRDLLHLLQMLLDERRGFHAEDGSPKEKSPNAGAATVVMVDLRGLEPSGSNGGLQSYVMWLIPWLCQHHRESFRFLAVARQENVEIVSSLLGPEDAVLMQAVEDRVLRGPGTEPAVVKTALPLDAVAEQMGVSVLYCPLGPLAFRRDGIRTVCLVTDLLHIELPYCLPHEICKARDRDFARVAEDATLIQCISRSAQELLEQHYPAARKRTFLTYLPIQERFGHRSQQNFPPNVAKPSASCFFYPANFWPHKNHCGLLVAYQLYVHQAGDAAWRLVLSGSDYEGNAGKIRRLAEALGVSSKVTITGYVTESELQRLWQNAGALIFPSLHEGFGIPLLEAMHHRVPILTSPDYSLREIAGDAALYFNPKKPDQIAACMKKLVDNPELAQKLRNAGTERLKRFDAAREASLLADALRGVHPQRALSAQFTECGCLK